MGHIISSYIFPHPPIIVPEVGKGGESKAQVTIESARRAAREIRDEKPTTIVITTPHGPYMRDLIYIGDDETLSGDLGRFGSKNVKMSFENNIPLVERIVEHARDKGIIAGSPDDELASMYGISRELDHGATVPLYYVQREYSDLDSSKFKLVHISSGVAGLDNRTLYQFGMCIKKAVEELEERVVFIASGDLSHRLSDESYYGYHKAGKEFDEWLINGMKKLDITPLLNADEEFCENAGECGLKSFIIMFGALDGLDVRPEVYSYEGPFGIGYSVAKFLVGKENPERQVLEKEMDDVRKSEDPYVILARRALETYIKTGEILEIPSDVPQDMLKNRAGTFVSIRKDKQLRGCIGTIASTRSNIAEEIIYNAISAGTQDPRFEMVEPEELDKLEYSVDVLKEPEPIQSIGELDVERYGVIVKSGHRSGLLLPNLEGIDSPEEQVGHALWKAGIRENDHYSMQRFEVVRHGSKA